MRRRTGPGHRHDAGAMALGDAMAIATALPVGLALSAALRRVAHERPEAFERLGSFRRATYLIAPTGLPFAFRLQPDPKHGSIRVVRPKDPRPVTAAIFGPLGDLLALFDGTRDADAAFFSRRIEVEGSTEAIMALHNALEAADLRLADLAAGPPVVRSWLDGGLRALHRIRGRLRPARP